MEELLTASTHALISASCKYHPPLPRRHGPGGDSASQSPLCSETLVPEWCYCLPTWRLHGNVRWLLGQYPDKYSGDQGPTNQSLTITCICPLQVHAAWSYAVEASFRSHTLYFPLWHSREIKMSFLDSKHSSLKQICIFTLLQHNYKDTFFYLPCHTLAKYAGEMWHK